MYLVFLLATSTFLGFFFDSAVPNVKDNRLEGRWELESFENEGIKKDASDPKTSFHGQRIQIKGNRWVEWYDGTDAPPVHAKDTKFHCVTKPGMPFKHFDYWPIGSDGKPDTWKKIGIYKLDGDRLLVCFRVEQVAGESVDRPRKFDASKGKSTGLAIYKRIKSK